MDIGPNDCKPIENVGTACILNNTQQQLSHTLYIFNKPTVCVHISASMAVYRCFALFYFHDTSD